MKRSALIAAICGIAFAACGEDYTYGFNFSFSPSREKLGVRMETKDEGGSKVANFEVADVKDGKVISKFSIPALAWHRKVVDLPGLDGEYEITMDLDGVKTKKRFERRHFPWEGNTIGKSETVYPPFIPISVSGSGEGAKLKTVLREHVLGVGGLPASIEAAGKQIFAGPARLVTEAGDLSGTLEIVSAKPNRVVTHAELKNSSGFEASAEGIWEEDGCLDWRLTMKKGSVESLVLEIPLAAETATMIHALGVMRATTSATLSKDEGVVWAANRTPQMIPNFCPYLFVGNQHRGFSWWAESPNGWGWSRKTPNCELVRKGDSVVFRVRIVDQKTAAKAPRTLRMGFMAAPAKPRPDDWLTRWNAKNYHFIATDICWFSESNCGGVQPAGGYLPHWEWIGDCYLPNRKPDLSRIEEIMTPVDEYVKQYGQGDAKMRSSEFRRMMRQHEEWGRGKNRTPQFYFNRSVWNNLPEWKTYMGEWMQQMWNDPALYGTSPSRNEIYIEPCDSYLDYACWWWKKSFELAGNKGVYCDNYFNMQSWNFWHPDGLGRNVIWALRTQAKRVRQMMCELGMEPFFWPHMSSQSLMPWMSFSEGQLDWEWNMGGGPLQKRFSREYLKLATWGELGGIVPKALMDRGGISRPHDRNTFVAGLNLCGMTAYFDGDGSPFDDKVRNVYQKSPKLKFWNSFMDGKLPVKCSDPSVEWCVWCIPGERALIEALSWNAKGGIAKVLSMGGKEAVFEVDYAALGLPAPLAEGAPSAEAAGDKMDSLMDDGDGGLGSQGLALDDSPLDFYNMIEKGAQPAGKKGFSVKFGTYGCFVGEFTR